MNNKILLSGAMILMAVLSLVTHPLCILANPIPQDTLLMPEEWLYVRISQSPVTENDATTNLPLQAQVEGIYPMQNPDLKQVKILDPVPRDSRRIAVDLDGNPLAWIWSDRKYETVLPEWPAIPELLWDITPVPREFKLRVLYEHDLVRRPAEWVFLYPLGCWEGQPIYSPHMTAHMQVSLPNRYLPKGVYLDKDPAPFNLLPLRGGDKAYSAGWQVTGTYTSRPFRALDKDYILFLMDRWQDPQAWFSQPPDMANGFDIVSTEISASPVPADDFILNGVAGENKNISHLRFWGSYPGWFTSNPNAQYLDIVQPRPDYFTICIYDTLPVSTAIQAPRPGRLVYTARIKDFSQNYFGMVVRENNALAVSEPVYTYNHKFEYNLDFKKPFFPVPGQRYWLKIVAGPVSGAKTWGWSTSPVDETYPAWGVLADSTSEELIDVKDLSQYGQAESSPLPPWLQMAFSLSTGKETVKTTHYKLIEGSVLLVDWKATTETDNEQILLPLSQSLPLYGDFSLSTVQPDPSSNSAGDLVCKIENLEFRPKGDPNKYWGHNGQGSYLLNRMFSKPPIQLMKLSINIDRSAPITFYSGQVKVPADINFPWIDIQLPMADEGNTGVGPYYTLRLVAVPWEQVGFSTATSFTAGKLGAQKISDGDLLDSAGKIFLYHRELISRFRLLPTFAEQQVGLDALMPPIARSLPLTDQTAFPEIWFSTNRDLIAEGKPGEGDILSTTGQIILSNARLIGAFSPMPPPLPCGVDALSLFYAGSGSQQNVAKEAPILLFSTGKSFFSERLGVTVSDGDLLSQDGTIYRTNKELMAQFKPLSTNREGFGLDAVYVWPHGEIWFSVTTDFQDERYGTVRNGDLLSDNGRIVLRNLDLLASFQPLEKMIDFGLDALYIP